MKIRRVGAELFHAARQNNEQTNIMDVSKATAFFLRKKSVAFETSFYFLLTCYELLHYQ